MLFGSRLNRLATSIRQGISKYAVGSSNPGLVFDFIDNFYQKNKNQTVNFSGAITHARAGNATMTDGYGPELVTNGGFDSDSDWSKGTGWSIADGRSNRTSTGSVTYLSQSVSFTAGKVYEVSYNLTREGGGTTIQFVGGTSVNGAFQNSSGRKTEFIKAESGNITFRIQGSSTFAGSIDNVSVREMPVIKWAPHNLLTYSEDFSNAAWSNISGAQPYLVSGVGPNGEDAYKVEAGTGWADLNQYNVGDIGNTVTGTVFIKSVDGTAGTFSMYFSGSDSKTGLTIPADWQEVSATKTITAGASFSIRNATKDFYILRAHLHRSDLGGMVDNPDQPLSRASYVPTTSAAKYLPRVGHGRLADGIVNVSAALVTLEPDVGM